jgi:chromosome segregation ATPase
LLVNQGFSAAAGARGGRADRGQRAPREGATRPTQRDPAQMQRMMTERMKEPLGASDEEWKVIQPRLQKVMELNRQVNAPGRGMMFGGRGPAGGQRTRPGTGQAQREPSAVEKATEELQEALSSKTATSEQIKEKLTALRKAKEKAAKDLAAAQNELKKDLTVKQEAVLVLSGYLN